MQHISQVKTRDLLLIIYLLLAGVSQTSAQSIISSDYLKSLEKRNNPTNCEENSAILNGINQQAGKEGVIIIISRLGVGERQELHNRRLHNAKTYLTAFFGRNPTTITMAKGETVKGYGRVELYSGAFFDALVIKHKRDLSVGICVFEGEDPCINEYEKKLYPCLARRVKVKKRA